MSLLLVTPPVGEPLTLSDVKAWCRVTGDQDDQVLAPLITTARRSFEGPETWFGRALLTQTWDLKLDRFPGPPPSNATVAIVVPLPPLQSVTSIQYLDPDGVSLTLPATNYVVDTISAPGRIVPGFGLIWPPTRAIPNAVSVRFVAGYGATPTAIPQEIRMWLRQCVAYLFENREASTLPAAFYWSMAQYKAAWNL